MRAGANSPSFPSRTLQQLPRLRFGGSPLLPEESVTTLEVATYLVADRKVPNDVISQFVRALFDERQKLSAEAPIAALIKAASTDKDAIFPVHPGAKAYYDGEETTLMERYGDWLFYGPMLFGAFGSALIGLRRFLQPEPDGPHLLPRFGLVVTAVKEASTLSDLERVRADVDAAVERLAARSLHVTSDQERIALTGITVSYVNQLIAERREKLLSETMRDPAHRSAAE
jgi:uncharacterized protein